jgi:uncharacterized protein YggE
MAFHVGKENAMKILSCIMLGATLTVLGMAQEHPAPIAMANSVAVGADGKYESAPDTALFQFNISAQEATSQAAYDRASRATQQVRDLLKTNQIDPKDAEIGSFSLDPVYDYRNAKRKLVGYRVNTSVSLKLKDFKKIGPIVQQLSDLDVTENQNLSYTLQEMEAAKAKAVEDAYRKAHEEAATLARAAGRTLGELSYASLDVLQPIRPVPVMGGVAAFARAAESAPAPTAEFTPQKITVSAHVNAVFLLK